MNPRTTLILAVVAALLGAFVWWNEIRGGEERAAAEDAAKAVFPELTSDAITAFELVPEDGRPIRLERDAGRWVLVAPLRFAADPLSADGIASALADLSAERIFDEHEPLAAYGLEVPPRVRFWVGDTEHALRIGNAAPIGNETYVTDASGERVFSVATFRTTGFARPLDEFREKRVLSFDRPSVTSIEASFGGGRVVVERDGEGWRLTQPIQAPADDDTIDALLSDLEFLRATSFHDEAPDLAGLGLDAPWYQAIVQSGEASQTLVVGRENDAGDRIALGPGGPRYWVAGTTFLDWPRSVSAFRDRQVARFASVDAERFTLRFRAPDGAEKALEVVRSDAGWSAEPRGFAPGKASGVLAALANLRAVDIAADELGDAEAEAFGLALPRVAIEVRGGDADAEALAALELGTPQPELGVPARRVGDPTVYWLDASIAATLPLDWASFEADFAAEEGVEDGDGDDEAPTAADAASDEAPPAADAASDAPPADDAASDEAPPADDA